MRLSACSTSVTLACAATALFATHLLVKDWRASLALTADVPDVTLEATLLALHAEAADGVLTHERLDRDRDACVETVYLAEFVKSSSSSSSAAADIHPYLGHVHCAQVRTLCRAALLRNMHLFSWIRLAVYDEVVEPAQTFVESLLE